MDESGSTTFVFFDQIIPKHLGRNVWEYSFWGARKGKDESTLLNINRGTKLATWVT